jgi:hypothetical protein
VRGSGIAIASGFHSPIEKDSLPILLRGQDPIINVEGHKLSTSRLPRAWQKAIDTSRLLLSLLAASKLKLPPATAGVMRLFAVLDVDCPDLLPKMAVEPTQERMEELPFLLRLRPRLNFDRNYLAAAALKINPALVFLV